MTQDLHDCLLDPSLHLSPQKDWEDLVTFLLKNNGFNNFIIYNLNNSVIRHCCGSSEVNELTLSILILEFTKQEPKFLNRIKNLFSNSFSWTNLNVIKLLNLVRLLTPVIFKSERDIFILIIKNSLKSVTGFTSSLYAYENFFLEKEKELFLEKLSRLIKKLKINSKNCSIVARSLLNNDIFKWVQEDSELSLGLGRFVKHFSSREFTCDNFQLTKSLLTLNKNNQDKILELQEIYVKKICESYARYDKRILFILGYPGTSPKFAFLQLTKLNKDTKFMFSKFPELKKLAAIA